MISHLGRVVTDRRGVPEPPRVVELVGPAGAGKSTVSRALSQRDRTVRGGIGLWGLPHALLAVHAARLMPTLIRQCRRPTSLSWRNLTQVVRLNALYQRMEREATTTCRVVLLDEGPVFALSWLLVFHRDAVASGYLGSWWREAIGQWATALDAVVLLDAPDPVLVQRIRARAKPHLAKSQTDQEVFEFLATFRAAFSQVIGALTSRNGTKVIACSTARQSPDQTADVIRASLEAEWRT